MPLYLVNKTNKQKLFVIGNQPARQKDNNSNFLEEMCHILMHCGKGGTDGKLLFVLSVAAVVGTYLLDYKATLVMT